MMSLTPPTQPMVNIPSLEVLLHEGKDKSGQGRQIGGGGGVAGGWSPPVFILNKMALF